MHMRKNKGFSLLVVLILSIIAMFFAGVTLNITTNSAGSGRVSSRSGDTYNILQSEIERARSALKEEMFSRKDAIKCGLSEKDTVNSIQDLEVLKDGAPFWRVDYKRKFMGQTGDVSVRIYDMQYFSENVAPGANRADMPPSVKLEGKESGPGTSEALEPGTSMSSGSGPALDAGIYLIRATATFANGVTHKLDVSVIQNSNSKA
jgi:hypothetical protein